MEWQFHGDDQWVFGKKIRGVVRWPIAEIYFDEDQYCDKHGGWVWMTHIPEVYNGPRGWGNNLEHALEQAEKALQKAGIVLEEI